MGRLSWSRGSPALFVWRPEQSPCLVPGFLAAFRSKAPEGAFAFRFSLRHVAKIRSGAQETGFSLILRHGIRRWDAGLGCDAQTRQQLDAILKTYEQTRTQAGAILGNLQGLVSAREAQVAIINDSEPLRKGLETLQQRLSTEGGLTGRHLALISPLVEFRVIESDRKRAQRWRVTPGVRFAGGQKVRVREQNVTLGQHEIVQVGDDASVSFTYVSPRILTE